MPQICAGFRVGQVCLFERGELAQPYSFGKGIIMKSTKKGPQKSPKSTRMTGQKPKAFTDEERAAMKEHVQEWKAEARAVGA